MTDEEWAIFAPFLATGSARGGRPPQNQRQVLDGIFWIARTGAPGRDLPEEFDDCSSIWRQFRWSGVKDRTGDFVKYRAEPTPPHLTRCGVSQV